MNVKSIRKEIQMRILHWVGPGTIPPRLDGYPTSGVVRVALEIASRQAQKGDDVTVAGIRSDATSYQWKGVEIRGVKPLRWAKAHALGREWDFRQHVALLRVTRERHWDIVHTHMYHYVRFVPTDLRVVHIHSNPDVNGDAQGFQRLDKDADLIVAVSPFVANRLRDVMKTPVVVVSNAIDHVLELSEGQRVERRKALRARVGLADDAFLFFFAGAFVPEKGLDILIQAFEQTAAAGAHLLLAGDETLWGNATSRVATPYGAQVKRLLNSDRLAGHVHLLGKLPPEDMALLYDGGDVAVIPSTWDEGFCLVALEAMAHGKTVVASRSGALNDLVGNGRGILVDKADAEALSQVLLHVMKDGALRARTSRLAAEYARQFSWEDSLDVLYKSYQMAMTGQSRAKRPV